MPRSRRARRRDRVLRRLRSRVARRELARVASAVVHPVNPVVSHHGWSRCRRAASTRTDAPTRRAFARADRLRSARPRTLGWGSHAISPPDRFAGCYGQACGKQRGDGFQPRRNAWIDWLVANVFTPNPSFGLLIRPASAGVGSRGSAATQPHHRRRVRLPGECGRDHVTPARASPGSKPAAVTAKIARRCRVGIGAAERLPRAVRPLVVREEREPGAEIRVGARDTRGRERLDRGSTVVSTSASFPVGSPLKSQPPLASCAARMYATVLAGTRRRRASSPAPRTTSR